MKNKMKKMCRFLSIGLMVATPAWAMPRVPTATAPKLPAGVSQADWQQVSQHIRSQQQRAVATIAQQAYIKASNTEANDHFGYSVALSGDTLAVGVPYEDSTATGINGNQTDNSADNAGAVYVFTRTGSTWTQQAYIKASNTEAGDRFGASVALSGATLAVGAIYEDSTATGINGNQTNNSANRAGAVYVFTRNGSAWTQQAYIKASNTGADDHFGHSVALSGATLAVGAIWEASTATGINGNQTDNSADRAGAVYVFTRTGSTWTQQAYIKASNPEADDYFGFSVALSGDTLAVGAYLEDSSATGINGTQTNNSALGAGAVYVFIRSGSTWSQQAYIKASNTEAGDLFGLSVALSGATLAVGAVYEDSTATGINGNQTDNSASNAGAVYVFTRTGTSWTQQAYIKASNTGAEDRFGWSVALSGNTLAVGADGEASNATGINGNQTDNSATDAGAVYVFTRTGSTWTQQAYIKASNTESWDYFGWSVALSGDTLAVGADGEDSSATGSNGNQTDNSASYAGAVYVFVNPPLVTAPAVSTGAPSLITATSAILQGTVNPNGAASTVTFDFGLTASYGTSVAATPASIAATAVATSVSASKTGLTCATTYHYRVTAVNSAGTTNGADKAFTTSVCPRDLIVTNITLNPAKPVAGTAFSAVVTVKNQGTSATAANKLKLWPNLATVPVCTTAAPKVADIAAIAAGASVNINVSGLTSNLVGSNTFRAFADGTCVVGETNEANNQRILSYRIGGRLPDLIITNITLTPAAPAKNTVFSAAITVKNQGNTFTDTNYLDVWTNQATAQTCGALGNTWIDVGMLNAGASKVINVTGLNAGATAGAKTLRAFVDSWCETVESNEVNNQLTKTYTVQ